MEVVGSGRLLESRSTPPYTLTACLRDLEAAGMRCEVLQNHYGIVLAKHPGVQSDPIRRSK